MVNGDLTLANTRLYDNLNDRSWQNLRKSRIENEEQWKLFDNDVLDTLRLADVLVEDKSAALREAAHKEKSLREEYLRIKIENDKLKMKQSQSAVMNREVAMKLTSELQSMTADRNELDHQLRDSKLTIRLEREEYERRLDTANQRSMAFQKFSNANEDKALTGRQLGNSTELPGHSHGAMMMSKVQHRMSDITRNPITNEDNVTNFYVPPETSEDDDMRITMSKFSNLVTQALEQQFAINNQTSAEAVKFAYKEGLKHGSTKQADPRQSLSLEMEKVDYGNSVTATGESILQQTPLQRHVSCSTTAPITESHAEHEQLAANIPDPSTPHGEMDGNKTFPSWASDNTEKRYKRETNLKFSEGSVEQM